MKTHSKREGSDLGPIYSGPQALLVALLIPFLATLIQWLLWDEVTPFTWFFYYPAAFIAALVGGLRGGILATLISALLGCYVFSFPHFSFRFNKISDLPATGMFIVMGIVFSLFHERSRALGQKAARRESEERFAAFMAAVPAHAWLKDDQGRYAYANSRLEQDVLAGKKIGRDMTDFDLFPREVAEELRSNDQTVLSSGKPLDAPEETRSLDGRTRLWHVIKFPLTDTAGERYVGGIAVDITRQKETEGALRVAKASLELAQQAAGAGIWNWDLGTGKLDWSADMFHLFGLDPVRAAASFATWRGVLHDDDRQNPEKLMNDAIEKHQRGDNVYRIVLSTGEVRWIHAIGNTLYDEQGKPQRMTGICLDITERKRVEVELRRANRTLQMLSKCNQILVHAVEETELLREICRVVVERGGYRMAWVGFAEQDEAKSVRPAAEAGLETGYLDTANITWADTERGRGPTGTCIRTGEPVIARNILTDPAFAPWREAAIQCGYAASASLPLKVDGHVLGALMVYAVEPDTLDAAEVELLTELAGNIAYGITALRARLEQQRVEEELHRLSAGLLQVQDQDRRHLARELHDTTAQHLAALTLNLSSLKKLLSKTSDPAQGLCSDCLQLANQAAQEIRTQAYLLHPPVLEVMGLAGGVEDYAGGFSARSGVAVDFEAPTDFGRLPEDMELALFRIVQESLANVLKHSRSARAKIRFTRQASSVTLEVQDMGQGIGADVLARIKAMRGGSGVGLAGMQERLRLLGGRLEFESGPTGTTVRATVPLPGNFLEAGPKA